MVYPIGGPIADSKTYLVDSFLDLKKNLIQHRPLIVMPQYS